MEVVWLSGFKNPWTPVDFIEAFYQTVIVLESMKMEIDVKAGVNGTVKSINVAKGENVEEGDTIFTVG